jgi:hypothetical protein
MLRTATQKGRLILVAGSVVAAAAGAVALRADLMVGYGFSTALGVQKPVPPFELAAQGGGERPGEVGDELYWLSRTDFRGSLPASDRRLAVGDRIPIPGSDGHPRQVEVVAIRPVGTPLVKVAAGAAPVPLLLVTARVLDPAKPGSHELKRFLIEAEEPRPAALQPTAQDGRT